MQGVLLKTWIRRARPDRPVKSHEHDPLREAKGSNDPECEPVVSPTSDSAARRRGRWRSTLIWTVLLCLSAGYMVVLPVVESIIKARQRIDQGVVMEELTIAENVRLHSAEFLFVVWFFAVGASIGSFLNVVAGRMAHGKSIHGSSCCPYCSARIKGWDIVPILGWLMLGGRCRNCRAAISPRYPFMEALTGGMFLLLLFVELLSGCANIPFTRDYYHDGFVWIIFYPKWDVLGMYGYHMLLLCFLLVVSMMEWERVRIPLRLLLTGIILGALFPAIWPGLHPVAWIMPRPDWIEPWPWLERIDTTLIGLVAGAGVGAVLNTAARSLIRADKPRSLVATSEGASMLLVGVYLGWQAALSVAAFAAVFRMLAVLLAYRWPRIANLPSGGWILLATVLHICFWRFLAGWTFWPGPHSSLVSLAMSGAGIVAACILARMLARRSQSGTSIKVNVGEGVPL